MKFLYWVMDGTKIGPYLHPPPIPILGVSNSLLQGVNKLRTQMFKWNSMIFVKGKNPSSVVVARRCLSFPSSVVAVRRHRPSSSVVVRHRPSSSVIDLFPLV